MASPLSRRPARRLLAASLATALLGLAACGAGPDTTPATTGASPVEGGTVRVAILGGQTDTLDVTKASSFLVYGVALNIYDSLVLVVDGKPELQLAESITPDAGATRWTIKIRDGVTFHDGSPVTADDVLSSLKYLGTAPNYGSMFADVDFDQATSDGKLTVTLALSKPRADLIESVLSQISVVFPAGTTDFSKPIGSGPFKVESYSAGTGAVLVRNDDYWGGAPKLERLEFIPIADATARMSAITGDQVDYATGVTPTGIETIQEGSGIVVQDPGAAESSAFEFMMNQAKAPFDDPEVREAFRLAIDREALVNVVFRGKGTVGNDVVGQGMVGYDDALKQRERDVEKAKQIFAAKGVTTLDALASEMTPGITDAAKLMAQQLKEAGVEVTIHEADPTTLFNDLSVVRANDLFSFYAINRAFAAHATMFLTDGAPGNYFGSQDEELTTLITQAQAQTDEAKRSELLNKAQELVWSNGTDAVWGFQPVLAAHTENLTGVRMTMSVPLFAQAAYQQ
ncbi:ABC transporter substrate-binding protein [Propionicicella superfundia]|uniref:ABC transporter substrate-binding protein n=1 Tax=Propionicicella superfundia TaxID=348582 RepID=UPI0004160E34|nr:ABC transporter substrate-binding protein [Propionicicella superfundia]